MLRPGDRLCWLKDFAGFFSPCKQLLDLYSMKIRIVFYHFRLRLFQFMFHSHPNHVVILTPGSFVRRQTPCNFIRVCQRFGRTCCFQLHCHPEYGGNGSSETLRTTQETTRYYNFRSSEDFVSSYHSTLYNLRSRRIVVIKTRVEPPSSLVPKRLCSTFQIIIYTYPPIRCRRVDRTSL